MSEQAEPSKLRTVIARVIICIVGVYALLFGLSIAASVDATITVILFGVGEAIFGLYALFVGVFRSGSAAVQLLASFTARE